MKVATLEALAGEFQRCGVRYLVAGGLAVIAHGYVRSTVDLDLAVGLEGGTE